jgi:hypothetical protein
MGRAWPHLAVMGLVFAALGLAINGTQAGVGLSQDSFVYLSAAGNVAAGRGLVVSPCVSYECAGSPGLERTPLPLTHFPPLYPLVLASLESLGMGLRGAARWSNVALFAINAALIGYTLLARCRFAVLALAAPLWMVLSVDLIYLHLMAWSEPLSLALGFGGLIALGSWLDGNGTRSAGLPLAAVLLGLAAVTRYAGIVYVGVGAVGLLATTGTPWRKRLATAAQFLGLAALPLLVLVFRNETTAGHAFNRKLAWHLPQPGRVGQIIGTVSSWVAPETFPGPLRLTLLGAFLAILGIVWVKVRAGITTGGEPGISPLEVSRLEWLLAAFVPAYILFVFGSITFFDQGVPTNFRLLAPIHLALIALGALSADRLAARVHWPRRVRIELVWALAVLLVGKYIAATNFVANAGEQGLEFTVAERQSPLLAAVRRLPAGARVDSNLSAMASFLTDRAVWPITDATYDDAAYVAEFNRGPRLNPGVSDAFERHRVKPTRSFRDGRLWQRVPQSAVVERPEGPRRITK